MKRFFGLFRLPKFYDVALNVSAWSLVLFGSFMIIFANVGTAVGIKGILSVIIKQLMFMIAGFIVYKFTSNLFSMKLARNVCYTAGGVLVVLLIATFAFESTLGSQSWIRIPLGVAEVTIQPSEFVKVYMVIMVAIFVERYTGRDATPANKRASLLQIIKVPIIWLCVFSLIIAKQPDFGTLVVIWLITALCCLIPSSPKFKLLKKIIVIGGGVGIALMFLLMSAPGLAFMDRVFKDTGLAHVITRFENAVNPFLDPTGAGHQPINGLYGFTKNGLRGGGLGSSVQKYGWLTQADNDYALAIIAEETGFFGVGMSILLYSIIVWRLFYYAFKARTEGEKIILCGVSFYIVVHFVLNVGGVTGLIPLTGVPLLFLSSGGSSLLSIMIGLGICQSVIHSIRKEEAIALKRKQAQEATMLETQEANA